MGRRYRSYLPGVAFHVTARTQGREPLFVGREERIVEMIHETTARSDVRLDAFVVMPNHLHLIVTQGDRHLADYMQALLCRVALYVQRDLKREGHVVERRYRDAACLDAEYYRNAITYVHLNPVRAGLIKAASQYPWSTHTLYDAATVGEISPVGAEDGLRVFADRSDSSIDACRIAYGKFLTWRLGTDTHHAAGGNDVPVPPVRPCCDGGDAYWNARQAAARERAGPADAKAAARADLRDIALNVLAASAPEMSLDVLRSGERAHELVRVRRQAIARALNVGYRPYQIARFFQISPAAVSFVSSGSRRSRPVSVTCG
jgi:REP element-mobilizing transposase RayT